MKKTIMLAVLLLPACKPASADSQLEARYNETHPNGRYQMLPGPNESVYVLDTQSGFVQHCTFQKNEAIVFCGALPKR